MVPGFAKFKSHENYAQYGSFVVCAIIVLWPTKGNGQLDLTSVKHILLTKGYCGVYVLE